MHWRLSERGSDLEAYISMEGCYAGRARRKWPKSWGRRAEA